MILFSRKFGYSKNLDLAENLKNFETNFISPQFLESIGFSGRASCPQIPPLSGGGKPSKPIDSKNCGEIKQTFLIQYKSDKKKGFYA